MNNARIKATRLGNYLCAFVNWGCVVRVFCNMAGAGGKFAVVPIAVFYWLLFLHSTIADCNVSISPPENGYFQNNPDSVPSGSLLQVECNENYTAVGIDAFFCQMNFFIPNPTNIAECQENCADPGVPEFGIRLPLPTEPHDSYKFSQTVNFECNPGTLIEGASSTTCIGGGQWSKPRPICRLNCDDPGAPARGRQEPDASYIHGGQVRFVCDNGTLVGSEIITCSDGNWSHPLPFCGAVIIHSTEILVTSGEDLVKEAINNITVNVKVTSSSLGTDVSGTDLWQLEVYFTDDTNTKYGENLPALTTAHTDQGLVRGGTMTFTDIHVSVDGDIIPCNGELELCVEVQKGDSPDPDFDLQGGSNNHALKACQTVFCETNECLDVNICSLPNQECINLPGSYNCTCKAGYEGNNCDVITNNCQSNPCQNGATCQNEINAYTCECPYAFEGVHCENQTNFCESEPCQNNATCVTSLNGFECQCLLGYEGKTCNVTVPYFTDCPQGETLEFLLPENSSSVLVQLNLTAFDWLQRPLQIENSDPSLPLPSNVEFSETFSVGKSVTLTATDANGNMAECTVIIKLTDLESPAIICPYDVAIETYRKTDIVYWPPAVATDNVGLKPIDPITYNRPNGSEVTASEQSHTVTATASDISGNMASCNFTVMLTRFTGSKPAPGSPLSAIVAGSIVGSVALILMIIMVALLIYFRRGQAKTLRGGDQVKQDTTRGFSSYQGPQYFQNHAYENNDTKIDPKPIPAETLMQTVAVHNDRL